MALRIQSVGFIGAGRLAERIARKLIKNVTPQHKFCYEKQRLVPTLLASDPLHERRQVFHGLGFTTTEQNNQILNDCDLVFIATDARDALRALEHRQAMSQFNNKLFVSLMGDLPAKQVEELLGPGARVIRMMPQNYLEQKGMRQGVLPPHSWATIRGPHASEEDVERVIELAGISSFIDIDERNLSNAMVDEVLRVLNDAELPEALDHVHAVTADFKDLYELSDYLGKGHYSEVYRATHKATGQVYAVKCIESHALGDEARDTLTAEVGALSRLKHDNIIAHHGFFIEDDKYYLVLDYCEHGSLARLLATRGKLPEHEAKEILRQVLSAISHCHEMGQVHRDIKAENILIAQKEANPADGSTRYHVKLADFGFSEELDLGSTRLMTVCGTPQYLSPEIVSGRTYGKPADIWSTGILAYMLLSGRVPFDEAANAPELYQLIRLGAVRYDHPEWRAISASARCFVEKMLDISPSSRATAAELLEHEWLRT